jgi:hypothetical protein
VQHPFIKFYTLRFNLDIGVYTRYYTGAYCKLSAGDVSGVVALGSLARMVLSLPTKAFTVNATKSTRRLSVQHPLTTYRVEMLLLVTKT